MPNGVDIGELTLLNYNLIDRRLQINFIDAETDDAMSKILNDEVDAALVIGTKFPAGCSGWPSS